MARRLLSLIAAAMLGGCSGGAQHYAAETFVAFVDEPQGRAFKISDHPAEHKLMVVFDTAAAGAAGPVGEGQYVQAAQHWLRAQGRTCILSAASPLKGTQYELSYS